MIEYKLVKLLIEKGLHITTAESCTGGMISSRIVNVPDASKVLDAAFVTYADNAKVQFINVPKELIEKYGVVSEPVAEAMAVGAAAKAGVSVAVSTSGIAGPGGGSEKLPVGTVCFGFYLNGTYFAETCHFNGDRHSIRDQATEHSLNKIYNLLLKSHKLGYSSDEFRIRL